MGIGLMMAGIGIGLGAMAAGIDVLLYFEGKSEALKIAARQQNKEREAKDAK